MTDPTAAILAAIEAGEPIGWQVIDADGNVVQSGPVSFAELTSDTLELLDTEGA